MANHSKDHTSIRVHAPPGGHSNNIFGTSEAEQSVANKKKQSDSDIFGVKKDTTDAAAPVKQNRNTGNNIFGTDAQDTQPKAPGTLAGQYKQTQMRSNIFGNDEPASTRAASDKNKSNIFGVADDDQSKRQAGGIRQGLRVGYNPINGESYAPKDTNNASKPAEEQNTNSEAAAAAATTASTENDNTQVTPAAANTANGATQAAPANGTERTQAAATNNTNEQKADNTATNGNNAQKNVHTSVRVFHPPGGKSNGPLW